MRAPARVRRAPLVATTASCADRAANLLGADTKGSPVAAARLAATLAPKSGCAFSPVPTAVPPSASAQSPGSVALMPASASSICATQPEIAWPSVRGVASCRWVRPTITTLSNAAALAASVSRRWVSAGNSWPSISSSAAMCITVGKASLEDWPLFTSSLGWMGVLEPSTPPASWIARLAMTSLAFMLDWVPEPVWNTTSGNSASQRPSITSPAARPMSSTFSGGSWPSAPLTSAAQRLSRPMARITGRRQVNRAVPIGK